jgi:diguanylate cyclase (GGDEF)-like protein
MDTTTEQTDDDRVLTEKAFRDLEKRLLKAEDKLAKAKTRAQATMQEIWQLDVKLKEEEDRANKAEARLAELLKNGAPAAETLSEGTPPAAPGHAAEAGDPGELLDEIAELTRQLEAAELEAARAADLEAEMEILRDQLQASQGALPVADPAAEQARDALEEMRLELEQARSELAGRPDPELAQARMDGLRIALHEAEERAKEAERKLGELDSSASIFSQQLADIQSKVREAEERALDWEERFHRSEERAVLAEAAAAEPEELQSELQGQLEGLRARIAELEEEVCRWRTAAESGPSEQAASAELEQELGRLRLELAEAHEKILQTAPSGSDPDTIADLQARLEEALARSAEWEARAAEVGDAQADSEALEQYKERLALAEERSELLRQKADQAADKLAAIQSGMQESEIERQELRNRLSRAEALLADSEEKLRKALTAAANASSESQGSGVVGISLNAGSDEQVRGLEAKLQEAYKRVREAEMKAGQSDLQLQKAIVSLKEYEQRANESDRETQRLAFQDALTGLPNLNLIRQYLDFTVKQVQRYGRASALLVVDLDRFKLINDSMGMKAGDELLMRVAERLQTAIRESDALGRKGEDEFLILLSELFTGDDSVSPEQKTQMIRQNIAIVVNRISECLSRPFSIQGQKFYVRASIGVSICPNDADTSQAMLEHADSAMYHAKESGRGRCVFYNTELHKRQERRLAMDSQLRLAMERGEFLLLYQPIIEITKGKGQIVGVEALLRWNHRMDGLLQPAQFLPVAEETGVIVQLGQWVCRQACWQLGRWLSQGANLFVAFNVSTRQMLQADLAEVILASVEEFGLQPGLVFVEIAEGSNVEEVDLIERVVTSLGKAGIRTAIDDFGVGYSSLSRLDLQHIQFLKIDPSLIAGSQQDKNKANICEAAVRLAQSLQINALAEGVETLAQARFLSKVGCQFMQGFYLQEPCPADEMTRILAEKRVWKF